MYYPVTKAKIVFVAVLLIIAATCDNAFAYTDPGSGLLIWQILCAAFIGVLFQAKKIIAFIKSKLKK